MGSCAELTLLLANSVISELTNRLNPITGDPWKRLATSRLDETSSTGT